MTLQSTGKKLGAAFLALLRSGLFFIPILLILTPVIGLRGIQIAQPIADILTLVISVPFIIRFFNKLPESR